VTVACLDETIALVADLRRVSPEEIAVEPLSHSADDRLVARLAGAGWSMVAKLYPDDLGRRCAAVMSGLRAVSQSPLELPEPFLWCDRLRVLLMSDVAGTSYRSLAVEAGDNPSAREALRRAGAALARLHACAVPTEAGSARTMADHARELIRPCPTVLADRRPDLAARVLDVHAAVLAAEPPHEVVPVHRDLHLGQLVSQPDGGVGVLDWDLCAPGDAALDLGNLLAYIDSRLGSAGRSAADALLAGYADVAGPAVPSRTAPYEALAYLRMAAKRVRLGPVAGGPLDAREALRRAANRCA